MSSSKTNKTPTKEMSDYNKFLLNKQSQYIEGICEQLLAAFISCEKELMDGIKSQSVNSSHTKIYNASASDKFKQFDFSGITLDQCPNLTDAIAKSQCNVYEKTWQRQKFEVIGYFPTIRNPIPEIHIY